VKALSVLGSTGSIGTQTLELAEEFPDRFRVVALTAGTNLDLLIDQILRHAPEVVALADGGRVRELRQRLEALDAAARPARLPELLGGPEGLEAAAAWPSAESYFPARNSFSPRLPHSSSPSIRNLSWTGSWPFVFSQASAPNR
jgi:1-deoxy-D-xylulose-5-phosphate reductoisomerase